MRQGLASLLSISALIAYPFTAAWGARNGEWLPALLALCALLAGLAISQQGWRRWLAACAAVTVLASIRIESEQLGTLLLHSQPILINLSLCFLFGHTLAPGRTPLISRIIRMERGGLDPSTTRYGRRLTWFWTLFTAALALESLLLALFADQALWAQVTGFVNYALTALLFIAEYPIRVRVLNHLEHRGFIHFLASLPRYSPRQLLKD